MKKIVFLLYLLIDLPFQLISQNLVPNGDFEEYTQLPNDVSQLTKCKYWLNPNFSTPDYFNSAAIPGSAAQLPNTGFGYVNPYSGEGIAGFFTVVGDYREYISVTLVKALEIGRSYQLSFIHTNGFHSQFASSGSDHFGMYFSKSIPYINSSFNIPVTPQLEIPNICWDTIWREESFIFVADDNYTVLTFGNFYGNQETTIIEMVPSQILPTAYYFIDKVELIKTNLDINIEMSNIFTPNEDGVNDSFHPIITKDVNQYHLTILNRWGEKIFETNDFTQEWDGKFNNQFCSNGTYFWQLEYSDFNDKSYLKNGFFNLIR